MNKDLKNDFYNLPDELLKILNQTLSRTSKNVNGYERLSNLCKNKGVNYGQAKKIKHEMENVDNTKRNKMNSGLENQFKKTHTKDKSKNPTKVRLVSTQKNSDEIFNNRAVSEEMTRIKEIIKIII